MSVLRKQLDASFTIVPNELLDDETLDLAAKGLVALMLSKPDGWSFSALRLAGQLPEGREAIRGALSRAEAAGWILRVDIRNPDGTFRREVRVRNTRQLPWDIDGSTDVGSADLGAAELGSTVRVSNTEVASTEVVRTEEPKDNAAPNGASVDKNPTQPTRDQLYMLAAINATWMHKRPLTIPQIVKLNRKYGRPTVGDAMRAMHGFPPERLTADGVFPYLDGICREKESVDA